MKAAALLLILLGGCAAAPGTGTLTARDGYYNVPGGSTVKSGQPSRAAYESLQRRLIARGRMRTDYAPADVPYTNADLIRDLELVSFFASHSSVLKNGAADPRRMRRWQRPVRYRLKGAGFEPEDDAEIARLFARIATLTGLDIREARDGEAENFAVWLTVPEERDGVAAGLSKDVPYALGAFDYWRGTDEAVCVFSFDERDGEIAGAHVFIGAEVTGLLRQSCFHEEIVQAMGLVRDDDRVRPSLFNDDEEFALFTEHDEWMMRLLYDRRLRSGMRFDEALPIARRVIAEIRPEGN